MPSTPSRRLKPLGGLEGQPGEGTTATPHIFNKKNARLQARQAPATTSTPWSERTTIPSLRAAQRLL